MRSATGFETTVRELSASQDQAKKHREIPFNYTSADDRRVVTLLLGPGDGRCPGATPGPARHGPIGAPADAHLRRDSHPPPEPLSLPGTARFAASTPPACSRMPGGTWRPSRARPARQSLVLEVVAACRGLLGAFLADVQGTPGPPQAHQARAWRHRRTRGTSASIPSPSSSHATDATDWRLHLPLAVVWPDRRGAGRAAARRHWPAGAQGHPARGRARASPEAPCRCAPNCVVVNTERLDRIRGISPRQFHFEDGRATTAHGDGGGGRRRHRAGHGARRGARARLRHRSHERLGQHHRRQHLRERRRQGGSPLGHLHRQPALLADGHAGRRAHGPSAARTTAAQDPAGRHRHLRGAWRVAVAR